jgi:hypothetical protein
MSGRLICRRREQPNGVPTPVNHQMCVTLAAPGDAGHLPAVISAATFNRGVFAHLRPVIGAGPKSWSGSRFERTRVAHRVPALHWMAQAIY